MPMTLNEKYHVKQAWNSVARIFNATQQGIPPTYEILEAYQKIVEWLENYNINAPHNVAAGE